MNALKLSLIIFVVYGIFLGAASFVGADPAAATSTAAPAPVSVDAGTVAVPNPEDDAPGFFARVLELSKRSEWLPLFGAALMLVTWAMRAGASKLHGWFATQTGGRIIALGTAFCGALGTSLFAGKPPGLDLVATALAIAWAGSGAWHDIKDIKAR